MIAAVERMRTKTFVPRNFAAKRVVGNVLMRVDAWICILSAMEGRVDAWMEVMSQKKPAVLMYVINLDVGNAQGSPNVSTLGQCVMVRQTVGQEATKVLIYVPKNFVKVLFLDELKVAGNVPTKQNVWISIKFVMAIKIATKHQVMK